MFVALILIGLGLASCRTCEFEEISVVSRTRDDQLCRIDRGERAYERSTRRARPKLRHPHRLIDAFTPLSAQGNEIVRVSTTGGDLVARTS
jgi:hypothetical protein